MTPFDVNRFLKELRTRGSGLGEPLRYFAEIGSTNDEAKRAAQRGALPGSLYVADKQTAGRGRRGRSWSSSANESLLVSLLIRPEHVTDNLSTLTLVVGVALREALSQTCDAPLSIKWPNDVLCERRKLAGVLVETQFRGAGLPAVIIGFGINVHQQEFPEELGNIATSLFILGARVSRETLLVDILIQLDTYLNRFFQHGIHPLLEPLRRHDALFQQNIRVDETYGVGAGINARGELLLDRAGNIAAISSGTVGFADPQSSP